MCYLLTEFFDALLTRDGLAGTFSGARVGAGALSADREASSMTIPAPAPDVAQTRDVLLDASAQRAFDEEVLVDQPDDLGQLVFAQVLGAALTVDRGFLED